MSQLEKCHTFVIRHNEHVARLQSELVSRAADEIWNTCLSDYRENLPRDFGIDDDTFNVAKSYCAAGKKTERRDYTTCFWYVKERVRKDKNLEGAILSLEFDLRNYEFLKSKRNTACQCFLGDYMGSFWCSIVVKGYMKSLEHLADAVDEVRDWFTLNWKADDKNDGDGAESSESEKLV